MEFSQSFRYSYQIKLTNKKGRSKFSGIEDISLFSEALAFLLKKLSGFSERRDLIGFVLFSKEGRIIS
jgi:hypothetical protein